jgi:hypothetical protein
MMGVLGIPRAGLAMSRAECAGSELVTVGKETIEFTPYEAARNHPS